MVKIFYIGALLVTVVPVIAQAQDAAPAAKPAKPKMVCRRMGNTGTRLPVAATCHTAADWAQIDKATDEANRRLVDNQRSTDRTVARSGPQ